MSLVQLVVTVHPAKMVHSDLLVLQAHQVLLANQVAMALVVIRVVMLKVTTRFLANADPTEKQVVKDRPVLQAQVDKMVNQVNPVHVDLLAHPVKTAKMVNLVTKDHPALQANPVRRVCARNTVRSMVVCSSKMAPGDKLRIIDVPQFATDTSHSILQFLPLYFCF